MKPEWGQFFMTQRGQFRMAFDSGAGGEQQRARRLRDAYAQNDGRARILGEDSICGDIPSRSECGDDSHVRCRFSDFRARRAVQGIHRAGLH
jgi:hypothetical protein